MHACVAGTLEQYSRDDKLFNNHACNIQAVLCPVLLSGYCILLVKLYADILAAVLHLPVAEPSWPGRPALYGRVEDGLVGAASGWLGRGGRGGT